MDDAKAEAVRRTRLSSKVPALAVYRASLLPKPGRCLGPARCAQAGLLRPVYVAY